VSLSFCGKKRLLGVDSKMVLVHDIVEINAGDTIITTKIKNIKIPRKKRMQPNEYLALYPKSRPKNLYAE